MIAVSDVQTTLKMKRYFMLSKRCRVVIAQAFSSHFLIKRVPPVGMVRQTQSAWYIRLDKMNSAENSTTLKKTAKPVVLFAIELTKK